MYILIILAIINQLFYELFHKGFAHIQIQNTLHLISIAFFRTMLKKTTSKHYIINAIKIQTTWKRDPGTAVFGIFPRAPGE